MNRPFRMIARKAIGQKRKRFVLLMTLCATGYFARYSPQYLVEHMGDIMVILLLTTGVDLLQQDVGRRRKRKVAPREVPPLLPEVEGE